MRCKYCNVLLEEYDKGICRYCGKDNHVVGSIIESSTHQHIKSQDFINPNDSMTTELMKHFIGNNYDSILRGGFSIPSFIFGIWYLAYRKFWKLFIPLLFGYIFFAPFVVPLTFVINVILGIKFKKEYLKYVEEKIINIRNQNQNLSYEELKGICKANGGVNKNLILVCIIIGLMIIIPFLVFITNVTVDGYTFIEIIENIFENYIA